MVWFSILCLQISVLLDNCMVVIYHYHEMFTNAKQISSSFDIDVCHLALQCQKPWQIIRVGFFFTFFIPGLYSHISNSTSRHIWVKTCRTTITTISAIFRWRSSPTVLAFFPGSTPNRWHGIAISPMPFYALVSIATQAHKNLQISAPQI